MTSMTRTYGASVALSLSWTDDGQFKSDTIQQVWHLPETALTPVQGVLGTQMQGQSPVCGFSVIDEGWSEGGCQGQKYRMRFGMLRASAAVAKACVPL